MQPSSQRLASEASSIPMPAPFLVGTSLLYWGGSSVPTSFSHAWHRQLFGDDNGTAPASHVTGLWGCMVPQVRMFGGAGWAVVDALMRGQLLDYVSTVSSSFTLLDAMTNDLQAVGNVALTTAQTAAYKACWRAIFAQFLGTGVDAATAAAFAYTGTWTQEAGAQISGSAVVAGTGFYAKNVRQYTNTQNDSVTYTVPAGVTQGYLLLSGVDDPKAGYAGAAYSISGAGLSSAVTGTTSNLWITTYKFGASVGTIAVKLTGLTPGGTLTVTKTDATGSRLGVEGFARYAPNNPGGILAIVKLYPCSGQSSAAQAAMNTAFDQTLAEFTALPSPRVIVIDPTTLGFDPTTMAFDALHPNPIGSRYMRDQAARVLRQATVIGGVNY